MANQSYNRLTPLQKEERHQRRGQSYERKCMGKIRYLGERDASWRLNQMRERKVGGWELLELYSCPHCDGFHLGHGPKPLTPEEAVALVKDFEREVFEFRATLTDAERDSLAAFLNSPTALYELKTHLPLEFVLLAADALNRAGLD